MLHAADSFLEIKTTYYYAEFLCFFRFFLALISEERNFRTFFQREINFLSVRPSEGSFDKLLQDFL